MASSMNEAGYFALSRTAQETLWWHQLLKQFDEQLQVVPATTEAHDSTAKKSTFEEAMRVASAARAGLPVQIFRRNHLDGTVDWFPDRSIPFSRVNWSSTRRRWDFNRCSLRNRQARLRLKPELIIQALMHRLVIYSMVDCWRNRLLLCAVPVRISQFLWAEFPAFVRFFKQSSRRFHWDPQGFLYKILLVDYLAKI